MWAGFRIGYNISFDVNCGGYLKRAADANTVELAHEELQKALGYIENHHLTSGSTRILFDYPSLDLGFWHKNLSASNEELAKITPATTQLEKTNVLIKLRETLLDHGEKGVHVTMPDGISIYPYNWAFCGEPYIW